MSNKPNILMIMADQMRWDCLGCAGNHVIQTPNLDALAKRGTLFRNAFSPDPICVPARATIMTGNYPHICTGIKGNSGKIRDGQPLLTEVLKSAGYRTYAMGKLHFVPYAPPGAPRLVHGFEHVDLCESGRIIAQFDPTGQTRGLEDYFDFLSDAGWTGYTRAHGIGNNDVRPCASPLPPELTVDHWVADCTLKQIDRHLKESTDRPFFMFMSSPKPHSPYDPPAPFDRMYDPRRVPAPWGSIKDLQGRNPYLLHTIYPHAADTLSPQAWQVIRSHYYGCISWLDAQIGRVLARLDETGLRDSTLVLFTADHGDLLGDFGSIFKTNHLNGSVRVPFIAAGPGVEPGAVSNALVGLQDILPTLAAAAGTSIGKPVQGKDISPALSNPSARIRDFFYSTTSEDPELSVMVTDGRWKYVYSQAAGGTEELYDESRSLSEEENLAADERFKTHKARMRALLEEAARDTRDTGIFDNDGRLKTSNAYTGNPAAKRMVGAMGWRKY
ncbi:MAG: sulfatase-like hydrolase/transferase [Kiritimatiellia bacterium]